MIDNLSKYVIENGGSITPLIIPSEETGGTGLCNPSLFIDNNGKILMNLRLVEYTLYHSEEQQKFQSRWGPLAYLHREDDPHLRTTNYYCEIDPKTFKISKYHKVDTSKLDVVPIWDFVGLEDARIVRWDNKLWLCGVRRDTTPNGQGRMELSQIEVTDQGVKEISRNRIEPPQDPNSYCEKNWMPVLDKPFHFIKWANPTELVKVDVNNRTSKTITQIKNPIPLPRDLRGGSAVIPFGENYIAVTHEVDLYNNEVGNKDGKYYHRFIVWDKNWNIITYSPEFNFMDAYIEFTCGLAQVGDDFIVSFGYQDNAAFILKIPKKVLNTIIYG
jgi:hypothetical protein